MTEFHEVGDVRRGDDGIPRDRFGRYVLPDPDTGKPRSWTRATTIAGTLKDRFGLERWDQRNIIYGIGQRPALYAKAAASVLEDTKTLDNIAMKAKDAADSQAGADVGTAIHTMAERIDRGEDFTPPAPYDRDLEAYREALEMAGITTCVGWIERVVCVPELYDASAGVYGICGQLDRLNGSTDWVLPRIGDIKTATDKTYDDRPEPVNTILTYGMVDIPLQLAIYAHASLWWDVQAEQWVEMPAVDQERAMVLHIPAGLGECRIYEVDIKAGWEAVQSLAMGIRRWRKRKDLAELVVSTNSPVAAKADGGGEASSRPVFDGKGGEATGSPAIDPPAPASPAATPDAMAWCSECTTDNDPAPWCDCQPGETCKGPCRQRAHSPEDCPSRSEPERFPDWWPARFEWVRDRVNAIKQHPDAKRRLAALWSLKDHVPTFPKGGPADAEQLGEIIALCELVEMEFSLPFGPPDPHPPELTHKTQSEKRRERIEADAESRERAMSKARVKRNER